MQTEERNQIESLIHLVETEDIAELTLQVGEETIRIRRGEDPRVAQQRIFAAQGFPSPFAGAPSTVDAHATPLAAETNPNLVHVTSPMVGVYYRTPAPGAEPFVEVGSLVEEGQIIGLVEAMKVFNEIEAEFSGKVVAIPAKNEQLVHHGDTLVILERMDV